jgi:hypothetical protein
MKKKDDFIIKKNKNEIDLYYNIRKIFITKQNPKTKSKFLLIEMYSNILINILFLKCRYSEKTEKNIINFIKKYKNNIKKSIINNRLNKLNFPS